MRIGITFGGFCPLHQGHLDMIMAAKKECDKTYVFVCGYNNDRGGSMLPLQKRFRIIKDFLTSEKVVVKKIDDSELGIDESMSENNWKIWLNACFSQIPEACDGTINHYQFYVAEQKYCDSIMKSNNSNIGCTVLNRNLNPISGTKCRANPLKYWEQIAMPFRHYYSHNILIAGTASEGKTTLTEDIGKYFGLPYSYEKGRDNCHLKTDPEFDFEDFMYNIYEQHKYNKELIKSPQNRGIFVSDTDNCITLMYALAYAKRDGFGISMEEYNVLYSVAAEYMKHTKWDKIFLLKPSEKDIVDDGERYMPDSDYKIRVSFFKMLDKMYRDFGYGNKIQYVEGSYLEKFETVKNYIKEVMDCEK